MVIAEVSLPQTRQRLLHNLNWVHKCLLLSLCSGRLGVHFLLALSGGVSS